MKILITYSSLTGNTRKLAEALHLALPNADLCPIAAAPKAADYDFIFAGFWVEAENANEAMRAYLKTLGNKKVALFATLGAYPDSQHAQDSLKAAAAEIPNANVVDTFICQGQIDPTMIEWMEQLPADDENAPTEARRQLWKDAEGHPNDADIKAVTEWGQSVIGRQ